MEQVTAGRLTVVSRSLHEVVQRPEAVRMWSVTGGTPQLGSLSADARCSSGDANMVKNYVEVSTGDAMPKWRRLQ